MFIKIFKSRQEDDYFTLFYDAFNYQYFLSGRDKENLPSIEINEHTIFLAFKELYEKNLNPTDNSSKT